MGATPPTARARRLSPDARRDQLVETAVTVIATEGHAGLTLDEVAERSGVTRGLIYHYFPRGRQDLFLAAVDRAGQEMAEGWVVDPEQPIGEVLAANLGRFFEHALEPSEIWMVHRQANIAGDPEVDALSERYRSIVVSFIALNHFGTEDPPETVRAGLRSFLDLAERALDEWRERELDREVLRAMLAGSLLAVVEALRSPSTSA